MGKMSRQRPEQALQISVAAFLRHALKHPTWWSAIGHGGGGRVRGAILKAMGVKAGVPDVLVMHPVGSVVRSANGCWLIGVELKSEKGRLSTAQVLSKQAFEDAGGIYYVARSVDEVEGFLKGVGIPLHARIAA
jgi:hypothetical protein